MLKDTFFLIITVASISYIFFTLPAYASPDFPGYSTGHSIQNPDKAESKARLATNLNKNQHHLVRSERYMRLLSPGEIHHL
ncbi:MAG: hypothetical protein OEY52_10820 [Gammaproteobacteria bacterium]|nr:hypothetical protein [Gammaproteobacteria bacterium]